MEQMIYVQKIRDLREDHDMTQQQVADYLGTSQTMYARYERGANELPIRHLISCAGFTTYFSMQFSPRFFKCKGIQRP